MKFLTTVILFVLYSFVIPTPEKGLIVIPGLGRSDRLLVVVNNLKLLEYNLKPSNNIISWECTIYIYANKTDPSYATFWSMQTEINYIFSLCSIIHNPGGKVTENLHMLSPVQIKPVYSKVFILLDDCKLTSSKTLNRMHRVMEYNNLTVLSPMISGANKGGGQKFRNIMQTPAQPGTVGYVSSFVEIFVWMMTYEAYEALWELLCPEINPYAWGYDIWYDGYASRVKNVNGHRMGILSTIEVIHEQGDERSDNASVAIKWKAKMKQESYYKNTKNINLKELSVKLANSSWNGAVKGYLYAPPNVPRPDRTRPGTYKKGKAQQQLFNEV